MVTHSPSPTTSSVTCVDPPEEGLRERKKRLTRARIHRAALELVAQHGPDGVTVEQVAARADVSTRTFFNYFPTKESALVDTADDDVESLARALRDRPAQESPLDALHAVLVTRVRSAAEEDGLFALRARVYRAHPSILGGVLGSSRERERVLAVELARRCGLAEDDPYPQVCAAAAFAVVRVAFAGGDEAPAEDILARLRHCFDLLEDGLATPPDPPA